MRLLFIIGVTTADVAATLVGYTAAHVRNLDIHDVVPVHDQLLFDFTEKI